MAKKGPTVMLWRRSLIVLLVILIAGFGSVTARLLYLQTYMAPVKGAYLGVEIAARQYNPNPLTFGPRRTLAGWGERLCLSPLPNGECQSLGGVQGALFKGQPCWGSRPQTAGATPPLHPVGRKCAFDGRKAVKSAFALLSQKVTKAAAGAAKGVLI